MKERQRLCWKDHVRHHIQVVLNSATFALRTASWAWAIVGVRNVSLNSCVSYESGGQRWLISTKDQQMRTFRRVLSSFASALLQHAPAINLFFSSTIALFSMMKLRRSGHTRVFDISAATRWANVTSSCLCLCESLSKWNFQVQHTGTHGTRLSMAQSNGAKGLSGTGIWKRLQYYRIIIDWWVLHGAWFKTSDWTFGMWLRWHNS